MKHKQSGFGLTGIIVIIAMIALVGALGYVGYKNIFAKKDIAGQFGEDGYIPSGKKFPALVTGAPYIPESYSDQEGADYLGKYAGAPGLSDALEKIAKSNPCSVTEGRFKQIVLGVTEDQAQALIGNGCGSKGYLRSFLIKQGNSWIRLGSWDGYFSDKQVEYKDADINILTDTPSCELVDEYSIQKSIAPVCYNKGEGQSSLYAGDSSNYSYTLRQ